MLKNKILLALFVVTAAFASCTKDKYDADKQLAKDDAAIVSYLKSNNLEAIKDPSGLYYIIVNPGTGANPTINSNVSVGYDGYILGNTTSFDRAPADNPIKLDLSNVIKGWQIGIPKVKEGGRIRLFIPSTLGYKNFTTGPIPANSILDFTVNLVKIN